MNLNEILQELRKTEESRVQLTKDKLQKVYNRLFTELNGFLANKWVMYSDDDGRLTVLQLKNAGKYARFLEEVKKKVNGLSKEEKDIITEIVEETYKKSYEGMVKAVKKAEEKGNLAEVVKDINVRPEVIKEAFNNDLSKITLPDILEKNRINVLYDVQQAINIGLMNGDRFDTVAKKVKTKLETGLSNAFRIVKTETHRNIEGGIAEGAKDIMQALEGSGLVEVAIWRTMKDERVRPQVRVRNARGKWKTIKSKSGADHQKMEGKAIVIGDKFELESGVFAECPGKSGTARNDINCRCFLEYKLVTIEEAAKLTGKSVEEIHKIVEKFKKSGIIKTEEKDLSKYIGKAIEKTDNQSIREWYVANVSDIPNQIDKLKPFEEQVRQAYELRNKYKHMARVAMSDEETATILEKKHPIKTFDELLQDKMKRKNMSRDEALKDILKTASETNKDVNKEFGL